MTIRLQSTPLLTLASFPSWRLQRKYLCENDQVRDQAQSELPWQLQAEVRRQSHQNLHWLHKKSKAWSLIQQNPCASCFRSRRLVSRPALYSPGIFIPHLVQSFSSSRPKEQRFDSLQKVLDAPQFQFGCYVLLWKEVVSLRSQW